MDVPVDPRDRLIGEHASEVAVEIDPTGAITFVTDAFLALIGRAREEVLSRSIAGWLHPEDALPYPRGGDLTARPGERAVRVSAGGGWRAFLVQHDVYQAADGTTRILCRLRPTPGAGTLAPGEDELLDALPVAAIVVDEAMVVRRLNAAARALTGLDRPDTVVGIDVRWFATAAFGSDAVDAFMEAARGAFEARPEPADRHRAVIGTEPGRPPRWLRLQASAVRRPGPECCVLTLTDITEEVLATERVRLERDRAEAIIEGAPGIVILLGLDGRIEEANGYFRALTGYASTDLAGADWFETFVPPEDRAERRSVWERMTRGEGVGKRVNEIITRDGARRTVDWGYTRIAHADGGPGILLVGADVTEREQMIADIVRHGGMVRAAADAAPLALFAVDAQGIVRAREGGSSIFGSTEETLGQSVSEILADDPERLALAQRALAGETVRFQSTVRGRVVDGVYAGVVDAEGRPGGFVGVAFDVTERERARKAQAAALEQVTQSEGLLREAEALAHVGAWTMDLQDGALQSWSDENYRVMGYGPGEVVPSFEAFLRHVHPDDADAVREGFAELQRAGAATRRFRLIRPDGELRYVDARARLLRDPQGVPYRVLGVTQDVTAREVALEEARRSAQLLQEAQRLARLGNWSLDLLADRLEWSDTIYEIFELDGDFTPSYQAFLDLVHPDDRQRVDEAYTNSLQDRRPYLITHRLVMPDGRIKWLEERANSEFAADGTPLRSLGTVQDITEQIELRDQADRLSFELARIVDASPLPIVMIDGHGTILAVNPATLQTFGYAEPALLGRNVAMLAADLDPEVHDLYIQHYQQTGRASTPEGLVIGRTREVQACRSDGTRFPAELTVAEIVQADGSRRYVGIVADRTEWRAREEQMIRMQKLEAVGTLIAGVAHDFNNLLTAIIGGLEMAAVRPEEPRWIELARQGADRAAGLVQRLLRFSRDEAPMRRPVAPRAMADSVIAIARETMDRRIWLDSEIADGLPEVLADAGQIEQVLLNLVVNARDAVIDRLEHSEGAYRPAITIAVVPRRRGVIDGVTFSVRDNGGGMTEEVRKRAFDPFFTTKPVTGTGLGLSIATGIVSSHEGLIEMDSAPGNGTLVSVWLPVPLEERPIPASLASLSEPGERRPDSASRGRLLLVDDESMVGEVAQAFLEAAGFEVVLCTNGTDAIRRLERTPFDLVVLDLNMPAPDGWTVLAALQRLQPDTPAIIASGYADEAEVLARGGVALVPKPYGREQLLAAVTEHLRGRG